MQDVEDFFLRRGPGCWEESGHSMLGTMLGDGTKRQRMGIHEFMTAGAMNVDIYETGQNMQAIAISVTVGWVFRRFACRKSGNAAAFRSQPPILDWAGFCVNLCIAIANCGCHLLSLADRILPIW